MCTVCSLHFTFIGFKSYSLLYLEYTRSPLATIESRGYAVRYGSGYWYVLYVPQLIVESSVGCRAHGVPVRISILSARHGAAAASCVEVAVICHTIAHRHHRSWSTGPRQPRRQFRGAGILCRKLQVGNGKSLTMVFKKSIQQCRYQNSFIEVDFMVSTLKSDRRT